VSISTFVLSWVALFVISVLILRRTLRRLELDDDYALYLMIVTAFFGVGGAKLYGMIKFNLIHPNDSFTTAFMHSGFGSFGMIVFGLGSAIVAMHVVGLPALAILDSSVPIMILAVVFGRVACFLTGDGCYGPPTDLPWGMSFPNGVQPTMNRVHPTPLYEILAMLPVAFALREPQLPRNPPGIRFLFFLFLSSMVRFFSELWRSTTYPRINGMTVEQVIAGLFIVATGTAIFFFSKGFTISGLKRH